MRKILVIIYFGITLYSVTAQSSLNTTQWERFPVAQNPAYAGYYEALSLGFLHRSQWTGIDGGPTQNILELQSPLKNPSAAIGINYLNESINTVNRNRFMISYAYRIIHGSNLLSFGLGLGANLQSTDMLKIEDIEDPAFTADKNSSFVPNASVGLVYKTPVFHAGLSISEPFAYKAKEGSFELDFGGIMYKATAGGDLNLTSDIRLQPSAYLRMSTALFQVAVEAKAAFKNMLIGGLGWRQEEAIYMLLGYNINNQFSAMYSYDYNIGAIGSYSKGSHELSLIYRFGYTVNASSPIDF